MEFDCDTPNVLEIIAVIEDATEGRNREDVIKALLFTAAKVFNKQHGEHTNYQLETAAANAFMNLAFPKEACFR